MEDRRGLHAASGSTSPPSTVLCLREAASVGPSVVKVVAVVIVLLPAVTVAAAVVVVVVIAAVVAAVEVVVTGVVALSIFASNVFS